MTARAFRAVDVHIVGWMALCSGLAGLVGAAVKEFADYCWYGEWFHDWRYR